MTNQTKHFDLIEGRSYIFTDHPNWGHGVIFIDRTGHLSIDFSNQGVRRILTARSASKLTLLPSAFNLFNKPARLSDGQLVVVIAGEISLNGDEVYKVFRETEPRIFHTEDKLVEVVVKDRAVLVLMNTLAAAETECNT